MTMNNNGNDKFKEWEEVKVTEKSIFAKTQFNTFDPVPC